MKSIVVKLAAVACVCLANQAARADSALVFNEIMYHPATNEPAMEWIEFHNQLAVDLDVSEWSITGGIDYKFPVGSVIKGRSFVVLAISPADLMAASGLTNVFGSYTGRLSNAGEELNLRNNSGRVVDSINYGADGRWPVSPDGSGVSLAKRDRDLDSATAENWTASVQVGGTPGAENFIASERQVIGITAGWRYDASGVDLGTTWRQHDFNDATWGMHTSLTQQAITTLYNTGLSTNRTALAAGARDPHYILTAGAQGTVGTNAIVMANHSAWAANDSGSTWIGVVSSGATSINPGAYNFQARFALSGVLLNSVQVAVQVSADDRVTDVLLNGQSKGFSYVGYAAFSETLTLSSGFLSGTNTLEFQTANDSAAANPGGFRALVSGTALAANTDAPLPSGRSTYYFRRNFNISSDPQYTQLRLNAVVADGAVFYVNGVEIHRQNIGPGPVSYSTLASNDIVSPGYSGIVTIPPGSLRAGDNVLAVEVHQGPGSVDQALLGVELVAAPFAAPPLNLAFNETDSGTNELFWLELINQGATPLSLEGYVLYRDAVDTINTEYIFPAGVSIGAGGYLAITNTQFNFPGLVGDKLFLYTPGRQSVADAVVINARHRGRSPDGTGRWLFPSAPTPGAANAFSFRNEIVINEIMYHHALLPPALSNMPPRESPEGWIELYNRSAQTVDLTGWEIGGGVDFRFAPGTVIAADAYLVVADDAASLRALYPAVNIVGNLGGGLSGKSDNIVIRDPSGNPADEVRYFDDGKWPAYADGGGSSLELRDPDADNSKAQAWAPSDETGKSDWQTYTYRMVATIPTGNQQPVQWNDFVLGLLSSGECLIDDISVIQSPTNTPVQFINNGNFSAGLAGWRVLGTHNRSRVVSDPENPGNNVLHVAATGYQEHMHNHIEATYLAGRTVANGQLYEISFRAKWLAGNNLLNTRLYFNRAARTTALPMPPLNGTPGARNSRYETNIGPTLAEFSHEPIVPQPNEPVTVSVVAQDSDGVASRHVFWSVNSGPWNNAPMTLQPNGIAVGTIPGQPGGVVQFYVRAVDALGAAATFPARGSNSGALYAIADGQANLPLAHNVRVIMSPANVNLMHGTTGNQTNVMSNELLPCTVIYDERRAYYDIGVHLRGSQRGRYSDIRTGFHLTFQPDDLFLGVHPVMLVDRSGAGDATANRQEEIVLKHILNRAGGLHGTYSQICRVIAPRSAHTGPAQFFPRHEDVMVETAIENGGDGTLFEMELIYYPTSANAAGYKLPQPDQVLGTDLTNLTDDKEYYRYNFMIKNHRDSDDYSRLVALGKAWSLTGAALDAQTRSLMDIDQWMRAYALVSLCSVGDMYTFGNNHNFFTYLRPDGKFIYFPWDMDFAFTRGSSGALVGDQNLAKIVNLPGNLRCMYAHMLDIINVSFNAEYMAYWTDHYDNFAPGQSYANSLSTISARVPFVRNTINAQGGNSQFRLNGTNVITAASNLVTLTGTAPVHIKTILVNGVEYPLTWTTISAWTLRLAVDSPTNAFDIVGYDLNGNPVTNAPISLTVNYSGAVDSADDSIVINEIMYNPQVPGSSYVELLNVSSNAFDLTGWRVNGLEFTFPGFILPARQFVVLAEDPAAFVSAYPNVTAPVLPFAGRLDIDGETLTLFRPGSTPNEEIVVDRVRYEAAAPWSAVANGEGAALQLVDAAQDNSRVSNWADDQGWRFFSVTRNVGSATNSRLSIFFAENSGGDVYLDDISFVRGSVPGDGTNYLGNGDFESGSFAPWVLGNPASNSVITTSVARSGNASMHFIVNPGSVQLTTFYQDMPVISAQTVYTLSFWYLSGSGGTNLRMRLSANFDATTPVRTFRSTPGANNGFASVLPPYPSLWLNELHPSPGAVLDNLNEPEPWLELYNSGNTAVSLNGWYLGTNYTNLTHWSFPSDAVIHPGEFKTIFIDGEPGESSLAALHTSFRLDNASGSIALSRDLDGRPQIVDYINFANVPPNHSYGSYPDGQPFFRRDLFYPTAGAANNPSLPPVPIYINEWMASNVGFMVDPTDGGFDDWFELYNAGAQPVDLTGYYLTDSLADPLQFRIPSGYVIPAGGHLLVWADEDSEVNSTNSPHLHVEFQLRAGGESIGLFGPDSNQIHSITFGPQSADFSEGIYPDATGSICFLSTPTPAASNASPTNCAPAITSITAKYVYLGQALNMTVAATDPDQPSQTVNFALVSAPTGMVMNSSSGLISWTPALPQAPSTNEIVVRAVDSGYPPATALASFTVAVWLPPQLSIAHLGNADVAISLASIAGRIYRVEYKDDLNALVWQQLPDVVATSHTLTINDNIAGSPQRFYQLRLAD